MLGLDCYLILRHTESLDKSIGFDGNLLIDRFVNAKIRLVTLEEYKKYGSDNLIKQLGEELKKEGKKPYLIPVGGSKYVFLFWKLIPFLVKLVHGDISKQFAKLKNKLKTKN